MINPEQKHQNIESSGIFFGTSCAMKKSFGHAARKTSIFGLAWTFSTTFKISVVANAKKDNRQTCVATRSRITHFMNKF